MTHPAIQYMEEVLDGKRVVGKLERQAIERHINDLQTGKERGLDFSFEAGRHAIDFFTNYLRFTEGELRGSPFVPKPWQQALLLILFGWKNVSDGKRRFKRAYISLARKNGKSEIVAGIALYLLTADKEPGAHIYSAATKQKQAKIIHDKAKEMIRQSPELSNAISRIHTNNISVNATASKFEPLSSDYNTMDGLNVHGGLIDELHAHKTRNVWNLIDTATGARRQSLVLAITTAGSNQNTICYENYDYSRKVLDEIVEDDSWFNWICEIDEDDDWRDESCWIKANPNINISVSLDDLREKCEKAKAIPGEQNAFIRLHCNKWTEQSEVWLPPDKLNACPTEIDYEALEKRDCYCGIDLSTRVDLTAAVLIFPDEDPERDILTILPFFWIPEENAIEREKRDRVQYTRWKREGHIELTPGNVIDYSFIRKKINELGELYAIREVAFDPWNATQFSLWLSEDGFEVVEVRQGARSLSEPMKDFEARVLTGKINFGGHPIFKWCASNVVLKTDPNENITPSKKLSTQRIDGVSAFVTGHSRLLVHKTEDFSSPYDDGPQYVEVMQ